MTRYPAPTAVHRACELMTSLHHVFN